MLKLASIGGIKNDERRDGANDGAAQLSLLPAPSEALSLPVMRCLAWPGLAPLGASAEAATCPLFPALRSVLLSIF